MERFEVWFQYNKTGLWRFESLKDASAFAKKFKRNKPVLYDLVRDEPVATGIVDYMNGDDD